MTGFNPIHDFLDASLRYVGGDKQAFKKHKKQQLEEEKYKVRPRTSWDWDNEIFLDGNGNPWVWDSKRNGVPMDIPGNRALLFLPNGGKPLPLPGQGRRGTEILGMIPANPSGQRVDGPSSGSRGVSSSRSSLTSQRHRGSSPKSASSHARRAYNVPSLQRQGNFSPLAGNPNTEGERASSCRQKHFSRASSSPNDHNRLKADTREQRGRVSTPEYHSAPTSIASLPRVSAARNSIQNLNRSEHGTRSKQTARPELPHSITAPASTIGDRNPTALGGWIGDMNRTVWEGLNTPSEMAANRRRADRKENGKGKGRAKRHSGKRSLLYNVPE